MAPDDNTESLSLEDVKRRFVDAEDQLVKLAAATAGLQSESEALAKANAAVQEAGGKVSDLSETLQQLAGVMRQATEAVQQLDPAVISEQLTGIEAAIQRLGGEIGAIKEAQGPLAEAVGRLRTLVLAGLGIGLVIVALSVLLR